MVPKFSQREIAETLNQNKYFNPKEDYVKMILVKVTKNAVTIPEQRFYFTLCEAA